MEHCDITSSQFVLCILSWKKIVKEKTRMQLSISVTRCSCGGWPFGQNSSAAGVVTARVEFEVAGSRMNTGENDARVLGR